MKFIKKWLYLPRFQRILAGIGAFYLRCVFRTSHFQFLNHDCLQTLLIDKSPFILAFWHGRMAMLPCAWSSNRPVYMLLSRHRDGQLISTVLKHFNIHSIYGSTNRGGVDRGGAKAARVIIDLLKSGGIIGITPDGPRGPSQYCTQGILDIAALYAKQTSSPLAILPCSYSLSRHKKLSSWDRFMFPFPFSKGVFSLLPPLWVTVPDALNITQEHKEKQRLYLEELLNTAQKNADHYIKTGEISSKNC